MDKELPKKLLAFNLHITQKIAKKQFCVSKVVTLSLHYLFHAVFQEADYSMFILLWVLLGVLVMVGEAINSMSRLNNDESRCMRSL